MENYYDRIFEGKTEEWIKFELIFAAIGADMLALYNLFPSDQANRLATSLVERVSAIKEVGDIATEAVEGYYRVAKESVSVGEHPLDFVVSLQLERLEVPDSETGPLTLASLFYALGQLIGKWKWILDNFEVVLLKNKIRNEIGAYI